MSSSDCFKKAQQDIFIISERVESVFNQLAETCGVGLNSRIRGNNLVERERLRGTPHSILSDLSEKNQLNWSFDGMTIHVIEKARAKTRLLPAKAGQGRELQNQLVNLGWEFSEDSVVVTKDGRLIKLSGTDAFLAFSELVHASNPANEKTVVSIYKAGKKMNLGE